MTEIKDDQARAAAISELVDAFVVSMMNTRIYPPSHPRVVASLGEIRSALQKAPFATGPVTLGIVDKCLVFEGRPLIGASLSAKRLIDAIADRGAGAIELTSEVTEHELRSLLGVLCTRSGELATIEQADRRLAAENCRWVRLLPPYSRASGGGTTGLGETPEGLLRTNALDNVTVPITLYQSTVQLLQGLTITVNQGSALSFESAQACIQDLIGQLRMDAGSLLRMSRYEQHDAYTFGHSIRVCMLAVNFARHLTADEALLNRIGVAALLHDIGKSKIPFEVLHCRTRLDSEQKRVMEQHSVLGAQILMDNGGCDPMCVACAFGHHLTTGAGGYLF